MIQFLQENWQAILTALTMPVTFLSGLFMGKKERRAKLTQEQGAAVETAQRIYDTLMEDMRQQYDRIKENNVRQDEKIALLEARERDGLMQRSEMEGRMKEMTRQIVGYERKIAELKKEIAAYEKKMAEYEHQVSALKQELSLYQNKIDAN